LARWRHTWTEIAIQIDVSPSLIRRVDGFGPTTSHLQCEVLNPVICCA
jgi:hypothetical protein